MYRRCSKQHRDIRGIPRSPAVRDTRTNRTRPLRPRLAEAAAAQLARIALDHHPVGAVWCSAGVRRCGPTRKSRASQIQGTPEEMDWTDLAGKRCAEVEDDPVCLHQLLPEHVCCIGIEFGVLKVFGERNRRIDLIWMRDDLRRQCPNCPAQRGFHRRTRPLVWRPAAPNARFRH